MPIEALPSGVRAREGVCGCGPSERLGMDRESSVTPRELGRDREGLSGSWLVREGGRRAEGLS